jgi:hypothetical protein
MASPKYRKCGGCGRNILADSKGDCFGCRQTSKGKWVVEFTVLDEFSDRYINKKKIFPNEQMARGWAEKHGNDIGMQVDEIRRA